MLIRAQNMSEDINKQKTMMKYKSFYYLFFLICVCFSCTNNPTVSKKDSKSDVVEEKEVFSTFIEKFHNDSVFALSRIREETSGTNTDDYTRDTLENAGDTEYLDNTERIWTKEELKEELSFFNTLRKDKKKYAIKFNQKDDCVEEILYIPESGFSLHIVFQLSGNKWFVKQYDVINL